MTTEAESEPRRRDGSPSLTALRVFVAVVETGSFSKAAVAIGMSQPNVSFQIGNLEQSCGGRELFVRARLVLSRVEEFDNQVRDLRELQHGRLSVGLSTPPFAMALIAAFAAEHPTIELATRLGNSGSLLADLAACSIDVGVMTLLEPNPQFACTLVAKQRLVVCLPRAHRLARQASITLRDLGVESLISREPGSMTREILDRALAARRIEPRIRLEVGSREAMKEAVAAGLGVGTVLDGEAGADSRLRFAPIAGVSIAAGVFAVCLKESLDIPTVAAFVALAAAVPGPA